MGGPNHWERKSPGGPGTFGGTSVIPTTQFPQAVGLAETWDPELVAKVAAEEGYEARYIFQSYDRGGLIIRAIHAGVNQFLDVWRQPVADALQRGLITEADLDRNLRGVLRVMIRLGLLDPPSLDSYTAIRAGNVPVHTGHHRDQADRSQPSGASDHGHNGRRWR